MQYIQYALFLLVTGGLSAEAPRQLGTDLRPEFGAVDVPPSNLHQLPVLIDPAKPFRFAPVSELLAQTGRITFQRGPSGGVGFQAPPKVKPKSYQGTRPLFGSTSAQAARSYGDSRYRVSPPPLITSRDVARISVWQSLGASRWYW